MLEFYKNLKEILHMRNSLKNLIRDKKIKKNIEDVKL